MLKKTKLFFLIVSVSLMFTACSDNDDELDEYKTQVNNDIMVLQEEINNLKDTAANLETKLNEIIEQENRNLLSEGSVYSGNEENGEITLLIDFKDKYNLIKDIQFIVFNGSSNNSFSSQDHYYIKYDEVIIPGVGSIGTDDVPEDVKRYSVSFPSQNNHAFTIIAIEINTASMWTYEFDSSMSGD